VRAASLSLSLSLSLALKAPLGLTVLPCISRCSGGLQVVLCHFLSELGLSLGLALAFVIILCFYLFKTVQEGHNPLPPNIVRNLAFYLFGWVWIAWTISHCPAIYHTSRTARFSPLSLSLPLACAIVRCARDTQRFAGLSDACRVQVLTCAWVVWTPAYGGSLLVMLLLTGWIGDGAAYYVGKNFGRHKAMPNVSPNKVPLNEACLFCHLMPLSSLTLARANPVIPSSVVGGHHCRDRLCCLAVLRL
jgi:CDP-diglyceride synthetase